MSGERRAEAERDMADKVVMRATSCLSSVGSANNPEEICGQRRPHLLRLHCNPPNEGAAVPWAVPKIWPCRSRCNEGVDRDRPPIENARAQDEGGGVAVAPN